MIFAPGLGWELITFSVRGATSTTICLFRAIFKKSCIVRSNFFAMVCAIVTFRFLHFPKFSMRALQIEEKLITETFPVINVRNKKKWNEYWVFVFPLPGFWARREDFLVKSSNVSSPYNTNALGSGLSNLRFASSISCFGPVFPQAGLSIDWSWYSNIYFSVIASLIFTIKFSMGSRTHLEKKLIDDLNILNFESKSWRWGSS